MKKVLIGVGIIAAVAAAYFAFVYKTVDQKRAALKKLTEGEASDKFDSMSDDEIDTSFEYLTQYALKGRQLNQSDPLYAKVLAISTKYKIFS